MLEVFPDGIWFRSCGYLIELEKFRSLNETILVDIVGLEHVDDSVISDRWMLTSAAFDEQPTGFFGHLAILV